MLAVYLLDLLSGILPKLLQLLLFFPEQFFDFFLCLYIHEAKLSIAF